MPDRSRPAATVPELVCPRCHGALDDNAGIPCCAGCALSFPPFNDGIPDLRLAAARTAAGRVQESIWDRFSEGAPTTPVDGFACRNDLKSLLFRNLADRLGWPGAGSTTIDLGCFDGSLSRNWTLRYGTRIVGVDASPLAVRRARRAEPFANEFHLAALEALPFRDAVFDAALSLDVFEHLDDSGPAIREAARVLKPGAPFLFYAVSSCAAGSWDWWRHHARRLAGLAVPRRFGDLPEGGHWVEHLVDPERLRRDCRAAGLRLDGLRPFHAFFTALFDDVVRPWLVGRRARRGAAEAPPAETPAPGRQPVLDPKLISPAKLRRLRRVEQVFTAAEWLDAPWRLFDRGRGFAAWGRRAGSSGA